VVPLLKRFCMVFSAEAESLFWLPYVSRGTRLWLVWGRCSRSRRRNSICCTAAYSLINFWSVILLVAGPWRRGSVPLEHLYLRFMWAPRVQQQQQISLWPSVPVLAYFSGLLRRSYPLLALVAFPNQTPESCHHRSTLGLELFFSTF
jgi:hypothetical protein